MIRSGLDLPANDLTFILLWQGPQVTPGKWFSSRPWQNPRNFTDEQKKNQPFFFCTMSIIFPWPSSRLPAAAFTSDPCCGGSSRAVGEMGHHWHNDSCCLMTPSVISYDVSGRVAEGLRLIVERERAKSWCAGFSTYTTLLSRVLVVEETGRCRHSKCQIFWY